MIFTRTKIPDFFTIEPTVHGDECGYFVETYRHNKLEEFLGHTINFTQGNESNQIMVYCEAYTTNWPQQHKQS